MQNIQRIEKLVEFQNFYNREKQIKDLYAEEESKLAKVQSDNVSLQNSRDDLQVAINEMNKKINDEIGKRDEINKRIKSLDDGKDKIKIARQIKSWEKEMEKQQQEQSLIQAQIDYDTTKKFDLSAELEKIAARVEENNQRNAELEEKINSIKDENKAELDKIESQKEKIRTEFDVQFIEYFEALLTKNNGLAIVEVEEDACAGCYTIMPTFLQGELGDDMSLEAVELYQCPHCFRYLYYRSWLEKKGRVA
jgi:predicted  nucleic acid-binding Zn-ribbon protein